MTRFARFCSRLHYMTDNEKTHELLECIPPECYSALSRQHADNLNKLPFDAVRRCSTLFFPQPTSMIRSQLHSCPQDGFL